MIPLFELLYALLVVLASSTGGDLLSMRCADNHPTGIGEERDRLVTASPVMTKSWAPAKEKHLPEQRPREPAETRHTSPQPSRDILRKGAAPLSGAQEPTARAINAYAQYACLLSSQMGSVNWTRPD